VRSTAGRRGKVCAGFATRPGFGRGGRGPLGVHAAAIVALRVAANDSRGFVHVGIAAAVWVVATATATMFFSWRGLQIAETQR
jgi:hypothetical protein